MGIPRLAGRTFELVDGPQAEPVTIVSRTTARRLFGSLDAVGRHLIDVDLQTRLRIVGVVEDVAQHRPGEVETAVFYVPFRQRYAARMSVLVRSPRRRGAGDASAGGPRYPSGRANPGGGVARQPARGRAVSPADGGIAGWCAGSGGSWPRRGRSLRRRRIPRHRSASRDGRPCGARRGPREIDRRRSRDGDIHALLVRAHTRRAPARRYPADPRDRPHGPGSVSE
ncbi:MAG: hypothetical protein HC814_05775 [Rhodobacteraceae bacterium]|nr:hypothetical protein [Paracoccaceae bacterium]